MSWLDSLFLAYRTIKSNSSPFPQRSAVNYIGATVTDDPVNDVTTVTLSGSGTDAISLQGRTVSSSAPNDGDALVWVTANNDWEPQPGGSPTPTGTGFIHITSGSQDAAAKLVDTADINASQVTYAKIQDSIAWSVLGRSSSTSGAISAVNSTAGGEVLKNNGLSLTFSTLNGTEIDNAAITYAKIQDVAACSVIGRSANSSGVSAAISAASNNTLLKRTVDALTFATVVNADVDAAAAIDGSKINPNFGAQIVRADRYRSDAGIDVPTIALLNAGSGEDIIAFTSGSSSDRVAMSCLGDDLYIGSRNDGTSNRVANIYESATTSKTQNVGGVANNKATTSKFQTYLGRRVNVSNVSAGSPYDALSTQETIAIGAIAAPFTVNLPSTGLDNGDEYTIKDATGVAATYNITVAGNGHNIDSASTYVLTANYQSVTVRYNSSLGVWMIV